MNFTKEQIQFIRNETTHLEQSKDINKNILDFMHEHQLFKLIVPKSLGGKMLDLPDAVRAFQNASSIDGNFGWLITIGSGGGMFAPNFTKEAANEFFKPKEAVIAGSGFPAGVAEKTKDGYIVSGQWKYCSGATHATMYTATCTVIDNQGKEPEILAFILQPEQVHVIEDWNAFGLKGTSSHTVQITDQFVPSWRAFSVFKNQNSFSFPIHSFPFISFSEASFAAIAFGIGKHFLEEVYSIAKDRKQEWSQGKFDRYSFLINKLNLEKERWNLAENAFHSIVSSSWDRHINGSELTDEDIAEFSHVCKQGVTTVIACANNLIRYMGMEAVMESSTLNRIWRDLYTASQHTFLTPYNESEAKPLKV